MRKNLTVADLSGLLEQPLLAILATHRKDGRILLSPLWFDWRDGGFSMVTWADDIKARSLKRDPRATVLVAASQPPYAGIEVSGEAEVTTSPHLLEDMERTACRYLGPEQGVAYAATYEGASLELIRLKPGHVRAWDFADDL